MLEPLEVLICSVIEQYPEYHAVLENDPVLEQAFPAEAGQPNPFLHRGMHVAIQEQIRAGRPAGIQGLYQQLLSCFAPVHELEYRMLECPGEMLWWARQQHALPDEEACLDCLWRIA